MDPNTQTSTPSTPPEQPTQPNSSYASQPLTEYDRPQQTTYDPNYLDSIAAAPPPAKFFSGNFGKIFFVMLGVFVIAVSLIVAFSGKDNTADLQQMTIRLTNMGLTAKTVQPNLRSNNLQSTNSIFQLWLTGNQVKAISLLKKAGVQKSQYNKQTVATEKGLATALDAKFEDARLNAILDRVYASTMAAETDKMITLFDIMSRESKAKPIREFAKTAETNLKPIQKSFKDYVDNGN